MCARRLVGLALAAVLPGCRTATQISVTVQTDVPCADVTTTSFTSGTLGTIESQPLTTESTTCNGGHLGTVVLVPSGDDSALVGFKVVTSLNKEDVVRCAGPAAANDTNCIVARRALRFEPHTSLSVIVNMRAACEGQVCDANSTCVDGTCMNATIANPTACAGSGCDEGALGPETADAGGFDGGGTDATVAQEGGGGGDGGDATAAQDAGDATVASDAGTSGDAGGGDASDGSLGTDGAVAAVPGCDLGGALAGAAWPMEGYCPSGRSRSPLQGPGANAVHKWTYATAGQTPAAPSIGPDGTIYFATGGEKVVALDPSDAGTRWSYGENDAASYQSTPVLAADGTLRILDGNNFTYSTVALDAAVRSAINMPFVARGPATIAPDGTFYYASNVGSLVALNTLAQVKWQHSGDTTDNSYPALAHDGTVFTADGVAGTASAIDSDGGGRWQIVRDSGIGGPEIAVDGTLRVYDAQDLLKLEPSDGGVVWSRLVDTQGINDIAVADDGTTYVAGSSALTAWSSDGANIGSQAYDCWTVTIDRDGNLFAVCGNEAMSFDKGLTMRLWHVAVPGFLGNVNDGIVLGPGNMMYVVSYDYTNKVGALDAFGPP